MTYLAPINASATQGAKDLLNYLLSLQGVGTLGGINNWFNNRTTQSQFVRDETGHFPAVHAFELSGIEGESAGTMAAIRQTVVDAVISTHNRGGIITMQWHLTAPLTAPTWANVNKHLTQSQFNTVVTPATAEYNWLIAEIDAIAPYLQQIRDAGIAVIWRPFHEMNGNWFWWCNKTNYSALWDIVYDRMVTTHDLHNLLWMWCVNRFDNYTNGYGETTFQIDDPKTWIGTSKCDILAIDIYFNDYNQSEYDRLVSMAAGKPIALAECGELPSINDLKTKYNKYAYFLCWYDHYANLDGTGTTYNTQAKRISTYNDAYVIKEEQVVIPPATGVVPTPPVGSIKHLTDKDFLPPITSIALAPSFVGQMSVIGNNVYVAKNTIATSDWVLMNGGGGGGGGGSDSGMATSLQLTSPSGYKYTVSVSDAGVLSAARSYLIFDDFNRADSASTIGNASGTGQSWYSDAGTWGISGNKAYVASATDGALLKLDTLQQDYALTCTVRGQMATGSNVSLPELLVRYKDTTNYLVVNMYDGKLYLDKNDSGVGYSLANYTMTLADNTDYVLKVVCNGTSIKVYVGGVLRIDYTLIGSDATKFNTGSRVGMKLETFGTVTVPAKWDDFTVESL